MVLAGRRPSIVPFTESSLSRLALLTSSRRPAEAARIYGIVVRAFPGSVGASVGLSDALAAAGRMSESRLAAERALRIIEADSTMRPEQRASARRRLEGRLTARP
jgi:hypothetical protein